MKENIKTTVDTVTIDRDTYEAMCEDVHELEYIKAKGLSVTRVITITLEEYKEFLEREYRCLDYWKKLESEKAENKLLTVKLANLTDECVALKKELDALRMELMDNDSSER